MNAVIFSNTAPCHISSLNPAPLPPLPLQAPFQNPGNGYFALWGGFLFSLMALDSVTFKVSTAKDNDSGANVAYPARGVFFAAVVLIIALIEYVKDGSDAPYFKESLFGMIAAACTILVCLVLVLMTKLDKKVVQVIALLLCLTWAALAGVMTFRAPFLLLGNGYFSSYAGLFMAFKLCSVACM
jgi:hypothetical protein